VKAQGRQARCAPEQGIRGDAPDVCDRYCSDCAWPYECAAAQSCHRRDLGEVRSENCSALSSGARCTRPDTPAPARSLVSSSRPKRVVVTIRNADALAGFSSFAAARIRRALSEAVMRSADDIQRRMTRPPLDVPDDWLCDAHAYYEQGRPLLIGYDLAASPSDAQAHEQGEGAGVPGRAERDPGNRAEQAGGATE